MRVLIIEEETSLVTTLRELLESEGHLVDVQTTGSDGAVRAESGTFDLVIVGAPRPDLDGLAICQRVRDAGVKTPILMLSANTAIADRVAGLRAGADDYLCKPFEAAELLARVDALGRRARNRVAVEDLAIDLSSGRVAVRGKPIELTPREHAVLMHLAERVGEIVSREELLRLVWGMAFDPRTAVVAVVVGRLRSKLLDHRAAIETLHGRGYRLRRRLR